MAGNPADRVAAAAAMGWLGAPVGSRFRYEVTDRSDYTIKNPESGAQPVGTMNLACILRKTAWIQYTHMVCALLKMEVKRVECLRADENCALA